MEDFRMASQASPIVYCLSKRAFMKTEAEMKPMRSVFGVSPSGIYPAVACESCGKNATCLDNPGMASLVLRTT